MRYAGYVCRRCNTGKNEDHARLKIKLPGYLEDMQRKRYGSDICSDCKIEIAAQHGYDLSDGLPLFDVEEIKKSEKYKDILRSI